jgi:FlaA1/EpsC-like NDP-sugar epimerase
MPQPDKELKDVYNITALTPPPAAMLKFRKPLIILAHIFVFALSLMLSFLIVNNMQFKRSWFIDQYPLMLVFFVLIKLIVFGLSRQYRGWWRYVGISDLIGIASSSLVSTLIIVFLWFVSLNSPLRSYSHVERLTEVYQSVFVLDMFLTLVLLGGLRMVIRLYYEEFRAVELGRLKRFLIVGAGNAGEALLREIHRMPVTQYDVVGFIDDDPAKKGISIHAIPVLGTVERLPEICAKHNIEEIAIAMPSATRQQLRHVIQLCEGTKIRFRTVPSITDIASGKFKVSQIRDVDINDLLGREAVQLDLDLIEKYARDKIILVTGAGGSIGSEMCRQLCYFKPKLLLLIEQAENPLFNIERELNAKFPEVPIKSVICNITDKIRVEEIFEKYSPEVIIHAAAHKHVPLMELNPGEAVKNNVVGTGVVADTADKFGCTNFVMISTDKAVNPSSIMGSSKRIAEMYVQDLNRTSKTHFVTVRFGNVLGSEGSVVPIFNKQIAEGGPVTVTHPDMKRYFMTIPEASQLVLQAATMGQGGEIFVLDMGEPVKIVDLARELITLSGFVPGRDIEITFTKPRPGEKLFEELSIKGEDMQATRHPKINIWKNIPMDRAKLHAGIADLVEAAKTQDYKAIVDKIEKLVPEYIGCNNNTAG